MNDLERLKKLLGDAEIQGRVRKTLDPGLYADIWEKAHWAVDEIERLRENAEHDLRVNSELSEEVKRLSGLLDKISGTVEALQPNSGHGYLAVINDVFFLAKHTRD